MGWEPEPIKYFKNRINENFKKFQYLSNFLKSNNESKIDVFYMKKIHIFHEYNI